MATPLDSDDDDMEERDAEPWRTVGSSKKRNKVPVVMKLEGTSASARRGSLRQNFLDKMCIIENDMSGREIGTALLKLSPDGINEMVSALPLGIIERFMSLQPKIETLQEIQTSSSSSILAREMGLSSSVGNASSFLDGIQAKRVSFNGPCAEISGT